MKISKITLAVDKKDEFVEVELPGVQVTVTLSGIYISTDDNDRKYIFNKQDSSKLREVDLE